MAVARAVLERAPLFDGHNDLPWVIRIDKTARGDVARLRTEPGARKGRHRHPAPARRHGRGAILGGVPADQRAPSGPNDARADRPHPPDRGGASGRLSSGAERDGLRPGEGAGQNRLVHRGRGRGRAGEFAERPLRIWHAAGVRLMTLCHNETLDWVDSATDAPRNGGLNAFGRAVIGELNRLGIVDRSRARVARGDAPRARRHRGAGRAVAFQRLFALRSSAQRARRRAASVSRTNGGVVMATFVPGFVSQPLRDWLRRSRDAYGKAPLAADPKAQLAELEASQGGAEGEPRTSRRPRRTSRRDGGRRSRRHRLGLFRRRLARRPRKRQPLSASVRRTRPSRLFRARSRERCRRRMRFACCAGSKRSERRSARPARRRSAGWRIFQADDAGDEISRDLVGLSFDIRLN